MMQALAGQSAGVAMTSASGRPGAGARVVIRGESSFSGTGQPLFVVDGVPVSVNSDSRSDPLGTGTSGSRQMDIDLENIDEVTILKGAAATALYGSRAANGAVIIKTKSGKPGQPLRFNFNTELRYDRPILGGYITDWAAGNRGYYCNGKNVNQGGWCEPGSPSATNPQQTQNWGPYKDSIPKVVFDSVGTVRFRDPRADFYVTAPTSDNSFRGSGGMGDLGTYTLGVSYLNQTGINPAEKLGRLNLSGNINFRLANWLQSTTSIQRIRSNNPYQDDSFSGIDKTLIDMPATFDMRKGYQPDGTPVFLTSGLQPSLQWQIANQFNKELTNRWIVSQQFSARGRPGHSPEQQRRPRYLRVRVRPVPQPAAVVGGARDDVGLDVAANDDAHDDQRRSHARRGRAGDQEQRVPGQRIARRQPVLAGQRRPDGQRHVDRDSGFLQPGELRDADGDRDAHHAAAAPRRIQSGRVRLFGLGVPHVHRPQRLELDAADQREFLLLSLGAARRGLYRGNEVEAELARLRQDPRVEGQGRQRRAVVRADHAIRQCERGGRGQRSTAAGRAGDHVPVPRRYWLHRQSVARQSDLETRNDGRGRNRVGASDAQWTSARRSVAVSKVELRPNLLGALLVEHRLHEHFAKRGQPAQQWHRAVARRASDRDALVLVGWPHQLGEKQKPGA